MKVALGCIHVSEAWGEMYHRKIRLFPHMFICTICLLVVLNTKDYLFREHRYIYVLMDMHPWLVRCDQQIDPYHTLKNQGLLEISTSYDTFATADRFNKHGDQNWNATNRCDVPAFPSDNLHVVRNTTAVNSHATQSSGRPYSLQKLWDEKGWETKVFSSDCS